MWECPKCKQINDTEYNMCVRCYHINEKIEETINEEDNKILKESFKETRLLPPKNKFKEKTNTNETDLIQISTTAIVVFIIGLIISRYLVFKSLDNTTITIISILFSLTTTGLISLFKNKNE